MRSQVKLPPRWLFFYGEKRSTNLAKGNQSDGDFSDHANVDDDLEGIEGGGGALGDQAEEDCDEAGGGEGQIKDDVELREEESVGYSFEDWRKQGLREARLEAEAEADPRAC